MSWERRTSGIFVVNFDPQMSEGDKRGYGAFVDRVTELPLASRYKAMALKRFACFQAVDIWQKFGPILEEFKLGDQWFLFGERVKDCFGYFEHGQNMLKAQLPRSGNLLVADVAGYLFGFPYEQMLVAAGSLKYVAVQVSQHYSQRYPGLVATPSRR